MERTGVRYRDREKEMEGNGGEVDGERGREGE